MNKRKLLIALAILMLIAGLMPLAAQNSPANALATGNVINGDVDTYMMVNFAPFVNYDNNFSFVQGSMSSFGSPGVSAGYATKAAGYFMNFYLNTSGFSMNNTTDKSLVGATPVNTYNKNNDLNLQFDSVFGSTDLGAFKLGLLFSDIGRNESEQQNGADYTNTTTKTGYFTPSIAYGRNFIHDDFSMLLASGTVRLRLPMDYGRTVTEETIGGITTTTTTAPNLITPSVPYNASMRLEIEPQMWYFFKPQIEPYVAITHIYLLNTFIMMFYPEQTATIQTPGLSDGYTKRVHNYVGDTFFGYLNKQYVLTSRFSVYWRINFSMGFYYDQKGHTFTKAPGGTETESRVSDDELYLTATVAPRLAFSYQLIPATLKLNWAVLFNQLGPLNAIGWQYYSTKTTDEDQGITTTKVQNIFNPIKPYIGLGATWSLSPYLSVESGISINTVAAGNFLDQVSVGVVYKK